MEPTLPQVPIEEPFVPPWVYEDPKGELRRQEMQCGASCVAACMDDCSDIGCLYTCYGTCTGTCTAECADDCTGTCSGTCEGTCIGTCEGTCSGTCEGTCTAACADDCTRTCTGTCVLDCADDCVGTCTAVCADTCAASCTGTCTGTCEAACANDCTGTTIIDVTNDSGDWLDEYSLDSSFITATYDVRYEDDVCLHVHTEGPATASGTLYIAMSNVEGDEPVRHSIPLCDIDADELLNVTVSRKLGCGFIRLEYDRVAGTTADYIFVSYRLKRRHRPPMAKAVKKRGPAPEQRFWMANWGRWSWQRGAKR